MFDDISSKRLCFDTFFFVADTNGLLLSSKLSNTEYQSFWHIAKNNLRSYFVMYVAY